MAHGLTMDKVEEHATQLLFALSTGGSRHAMLAAVAAGQLQAAALQASAAGVMIEQIFSSKEGRGPYDKIVPKNNVNMVLIPK